MTFADQLRAWARAAREKAETAPDAAAALDLLRDADLMDRLADLLERKTGPPGDADH